MQGKNKTLIYILIGLAFVILLLCVCMVAFMLIGGGAFLKAANEGPQEIEITVDIPLRADVGTEYEIVVTLQNLADKPQNLDSIDFTYAYLEGVEVLSAFPAYENVESYDFMGFRAYNFGREIAPGEELVVRFDMAAMQVGDFAGEMDVCIENGERCETFILGTLVEQP
jgi:hypothetical protein